MIFRCQILLFTFLMPIFLHCSYANGQQGLKNTGEQIKKIMAEKKARTAAERKIASQLLQAVREAQGMQMVNGVNLTPAKVGADSVGNLQVDINATITNAFLAKITALGGKIIYSSVRFHSLRALINLSVVLVVAGYPEVSFITPATKAHIALPSTPLPQHVTPMHLSVVKNGWYFNRA